MNFLPDLKKAAIQWRSWTDAETAALEAGDWPAVARCQAAKRALQPVLAEWAQALRGDATRWSEWRALGQELTALEEANAERAKVQELNARRRQRELSQARRKMGRIHQAYASARSPLWQSYS